MKGWSVVLRRQGPVEGIQFEHQCGETFSAHIMCSLFFRRPTAEGGSSVRFQLAFFQFSNCSNQFGAGVGSPLSGLSDFTKVPDA